MKKREVLSVTIASLGVIGAAIYLILSLRGHAPIYFKESTMNLFGEISKWCIYIFVIICIMVGIYRIMIKSSKRPKSFIGKLIRNIFKFIDKHSLGIISLLFAITIISVNVPIALFILGTAVSLALVIR